MWIETSEAQEFIREFAKNNLVAKLAPEEVEFFDEITAESNAISRGDGELGFGIEGIIAAFSPIALFVATQTLKFVGEEFLKAGGQEFGKSTFQSIKSLFSKESKDAPSLTLEHLKLINEAAYKNGIKAGLAKEKAKQMADTLVGSILAKA